jgi:hypothetical protein
MRKLLFSTAAFVITMLLVTLLMQACGSGTHASPTVSQQQTSISSSTGTPSSQYEKPPQWVSLASTYVNVSNDTAVVNPQIYKHLPSKTINQVLQSLARYNALGLSKQGSGGVIHFSLLLSSPTPGANNCPPVTATPNWWGVTVFLNHCVISVIGAGGSLLGVAGGIASALDAFGIGIAITVVVGILDAYSGTLVLEDNACGDNGAYLNVAWVPVPWVAPVC